MPSPIFISKPSEAFSIWVILRGLQLAILSTYRSLQNPSILYHPTYIPCLTRIAWMSLVVYVLLNGPLYLSKTIVFCGNHINLFTVNGRTVQASLTQFMHTYLDLHIFLITLAGYYDPQSDRLFLVNVQFSDSVNNTTYHQNLTKLPCKKVVQQGSTWSQHLHDLLRNCPQFKFFIRRYAKYYLFNLVIYALVSYPSRLSTLILCFILFQTVLDKLGSISTFGVIAVLNLLPSHYIGSFLAGYYGVSNLSQDLLLAYFHRINFTKFEQNQWLKSREGVLFGFGLFNYWLIKSYPAFSVIIYTLAQLNMGYLITKLTDVPPSNTNALINWTSSQLVWTKQYSVIDGEFINDPFTSFPGSFIWEENEG
ncbi:uncharacterized protein CANTADRAFT_57022 [Suhomyces tanzawaensis NRRL Y-17324]|uniref:Uncharacterized protein n=1 Tax=Suhomyces tanzawaensis NRRL Y-17324 TaxID=984487 RepID=A0A1E4SCA4_9ASCO|nr:uncharacterized protein CANTADRAFT_57022 [Suhomyces tanzawaensis NRRL Y-17324]ODV77135.1 hypothetical protein CANTADRAFT_57022 [Suhomyces tanzawaensis NRRL Y-17324]